MDLEVINSAIALGDIVAPPSGSIIRRGGWVFKVSGFDRAVWGFLLGVVPVNGGQREYLLVGVDREPLTILGVPEDCRPFEEWPRK